MNDDGEAGAADHRRRPTSTASRASSATSRRLEIYFTFVLALLFIYLVLAAQFESFVNPFIIMLSVPLSMTGALFTLWLDRRHAGTSTARWDVVTLVGLITKHGILIVEFSQPAAAPSAARRWSTAVIGRPSVLRLRPILMTTGAMVLGAVPLALVHRCRRRERGSQIGWVIVGGMTFGTLLTLYVVPTMYTLMEQALGRWLGSHHHHDDTPVAPAGAARHGAE